MGAANRKAVQRPAAGLPGRDRVGAEPFGPVLLEPARKTPSMRRAVAEARREVALTLPEVVRTLAQQSIEGSVTHLKLYLELSGVLKGGLAAKEKQVREKTLEEVLMEKWAHDEAMEASDRAERDRNRAEEVLSGV